MPLRVVIAYAPLEEAEVELEVLREAGFDVAAVDSFATPEARELLRTADALMVKLQRVPEPLLDQLKQCRIVTRVGTGYDTIDTDAAACRGIWVTNVPDYSIDEVSTHALTLMLALNRNLHAHLVATANGDWRYLPDPPIKRLNGMKVGVLGAGRIGGAMIRKSRGIGLRVIAHDPFIPEEAIEANGAEPVDFDTLMRASDFLSLHVPLMDATRGLIDANALDKMKPTAYLINTARGEVVDVNAVVRAVRSQSIAGAALDVFPEEPLPLDSDVIREPRILVTPHIGWASEEAAVDVRRRGAEDVVRVLRGERPKYPVNDLSLQADHAAMEGVPGV
jgi:D-3-phosphoglycerate dehydrogenase